jgi:multiple sugar transport system ATP-binding protein
VEVIEPLGAETHLYLNTGAHQFIARVNPNIDVSVGDQVKITPVMEKVILFDQETEQALSVEAQKQA